MKGRVDRCRKCGKKISVITWGVYRKVVVDARTIDVVPDQEGEEFVRYDGSKILGREAEPGTLQTEPAYRPHRKTCGIEE